MSRQGPFADLGLARRIESTDAWVGVESARFHAQLHPESGTTWMTVPGGFAIFTGVGSTLTQVLGLGTSGPIREEDLDSLEEFFKVRGAGVSIELCPFADRTVLSLLGTRGYSIAGFSNMLVRRLAPPVPTIPSGEFVVVIFISPKFIDIISRLNTPLFCPNF